MICLMHTAIVAQKPFHTEVAIELTTEGQYNFHNQKANWVSLLEVGVETRLTNRTSLIGSIISIQNTRLQQGKEGVGNDLQAFSNIESQNLELSLFALGIQWDVTDRLTLFGGLQNVSINYFTSTLTSLFSGSSQGIFPTISTNLKTMANYPLSTLSLHATWNPVGNWQLKNSFYNGIASHKITESFRFRPHRDGIFNITQIGYIQPEIGTWWLGAYYLGFTFSNAPNEEGEKKSQTSLYGLMEQPLTKNFGLLLEGGKSFQSQECHTYFGAGVVYANLLKEEAALGLMLTRSLYENGRESCVEVTYSLPINKHITVQPCMHFIRTTGKSSQVGLIRMYVSL